MPAFPAYSSIGNASPTGYGLKTAHDLRFRHDAGIAYVTQGSTTSGIPCLSRITLRAYPSAVVPATPPVGFLYGGGYSPGLVDLVFRSPDDLLLNPPNAEYPPTQAYAAL